MIRRTVVTALLVIGALAGLSCSRGGTGDQPRTVGVTLLTRAHLFYRDLEEGLTAEAARQGFRLLVTAAEFDLARQTAQVEDFLTRRVDAIIVCPVDSRGIGAAIRTANAAGIPVFTADIAAQEGDVVSHVASDNTAGGRLAGEYLARLLGGTGELAIINQPALTSVLDRVQGFREAVAAYPGLRIVADVNGQGVRDKALQAASDALQANPGLRGIFGINDDSALGALDAVQQFARTGIAIIGYDATPPAADAIRAGTALKADVVQNPRAIGETTLRIVRDHLAGKTVPRIVPVPVGIVDRDSLTRAGG